MSLLPASLNFLQAIVQDNTLVREFNDALSPQILFRGEAMPEKWEANVGDTQVFTRRALLDPVTESLVAGNDPTPKEPRFEQWNVRAAQYGDSIDTNMPSSRTALASLFASNAKSLGEQAGRSLNRITRNKLFTAYCGGDTVVATAGGPTTTVQVASINGFTTVVVNGSEVPVSPTTPKVATISGVAGSVSIIGATPASATHPLGPGTLTLAANATFAAGARVLAVDAPTIVRAGGVATSDGLTTVSALTLAEVRRAIAIMRRNNVPTHADGYYHVHLDPAASAQIFGDNEFQRLNQGVPDGMRYSNMVVGRLLGALFVENDQAPNAFTSTRTTTSLGTRAGTGAVFSSEINAESRNAAGVGLIRTIITGGGSIVEKFIDENTEYLSEGGINGKVGEFMVVNNGIQVMTDRIRYIIRAPQDRLQQVVSQSWSWSGDWGVPADLGGGLTNARYKRAIVIESGSQD
jgi:hypothetical protein